VQQACWLPCARGEGLEPQWRRCLVCTRVLYETEIIRLQAHSHGCLDSRRGKQDTPEREHGVRLDYALRTTGSAAVALFLLLSPTLVWPQASAPDKPSGPAHEQQTEPSGSTGNSATQPDAATQSQFQTAVLAPEPVPTPAGLKAHDSEGQQTKRMFWVVPNFAAVSADTVLPALTVRGKFVLAMQDLSLIHI